MITTRVLVLIGTLIPAVAVAGPVQRAAAPPPAQTTQTAVSRVRVTLPQADAELIVDGVTVQGAGTTREFETSPRESVTPRRYTFTAKWQPNTYTTMTRSKAVSLRAGERLSVDLTVDDPGDRVRVIYVPTPIDVADEMVRVAGVTRDDVVYEPGCGDARITIAAIRAGARRAICIDIDPERVEESRANVKAAGLADRIDVRLGDALDVKDLSAVTVVLLYMGDHFNLLIRPVLWRDLRVGARVVSHRFTMGDWMPDRTATINSTEGGMYDVHLWTVTAAIKRARPPAR